MRTSILCSAALCCLLAAAAPRARLSAQERTEPTWERYQVLSERNIFSRVRGRRPQAPQASASAAAPRPPQRYLILTGTVHTAGVWAAFIEDTRSSSTRIYWTDDSISQGRIADINLDGVTYEAGETQVEVKIGGYLGGAGAPSDTWPVASVAAPAAASPAPTGAAADLLERLRQRRQEELGK